MKRRRPKRINPAAKAVRSPRFKARVKPSKRLYSRKGRRRGKLNHD
ncbi:MAG: hypothetical protein U1F33_01845 [Alphaproteobacteria bacterium]